MSQQEKEHVPPKGAMGDAVRRTPWKPTSKLGTNRLEKMTLFERISNNMGWPKKKTSTGEVKIKLVISNV